MRNESEISGKKKEINMKIKKINMKHRRKFYAVVILTLLLLFSFFMMRIRGKDQEIVLEFGMFTGSNWNVECSTSFVIIDEAIERFEAAHPGVRVHYYSGVLKEDYSEWLSRRILEGEAPDVFMVLASDFNQFCSLGVMKNLDQLMTKDQSFDPQDYYESALQTGSYQESQYALPYEVVPNLIFVNKTLLEHNGLLLPDEEWDWEQMYEICKSVTKDTDGDGTIDQFGTYNYNWLNAAYSNAANPFSADGRSCSFTDDGVEEAVKFISRLNELNEGRQVTMEDFNAGNVAFMPLSFAEYRTYKTYPYKIKKYRNFSWNCITFPAGPNGGNISQVDSLLMGISDKTRHEELAWEFLKELTYDEDIQMDIFRYSQGASVLKAVTSSDMAEDIMQEDMEEGETVIDSKILSRIIEEGMPVPKFRKYKQVLSLSENSINKMLEEDSNVGSTLKILQKTITSYLQQ